MFKAIVIYVNILCFRLIVHKWNENKFLKSFASFELTALLSAGILKCTMTKLKQTPLSQKGSRRTRRNKLITKRSLKCFYIFEHDYYVNIPRRSDTQGLHSSAVASDLLVRSVTLSPEVQMIPNLVSMFVCSDSKFSAQ